MAIRAVAIASVVISGLMIGTPAASAQSRDTLLNGAAIGSAVGAVAGVAFTHAVRDSDLNVRQYAYGALVFATIGAGIGLGIDAMMSRNAAAPRRLVIAPGAWAGVASVAVNWRW